MGFGEFFKPTISKLVLPSLVVIYLIVVFVMSGVVLEDMGEVSCKVKSIFERAESLRAAGDNEGLQELQQESVSLIKNLEEKKYVFGFVFGSNLATSKVNPFYPVPCSIVGGHHCGFYITQEFYRCSKFLIENSGLSELIKPADLEYRRVNYMSLVSNLVLIFLIFYFISCVERWVFRLIWPKKEKQIEE